MKIIPVFLISLVIPLAAHAQNARPGSANAAPPNAAPAVPTAAPSAEWISSTRTLTETSSVEVRFSDVIVPQALVGNEIEEAPAMVSPSWKGKWTWRSQLSAVFTPAEPPRKGARYTFELSDKLTTFDGRPLVKRPTFSAVTTGLSLTHRHPGWFPPANAPRNPRLLLQFDEPVVAAAARPSISFQDRSGTRIATVVRQATVADLPAIHEGPAVLRQRALSFFGDQPDQPAPAKDRELPGTLVVQPESALPMGEGWTLVLDTGIPAADGKSATEATRSIALGDIPPLRVDSCAPVNNLGEPKLIRLTFNKSLAEGATAGQIKPLLRVEPEPANMKVTLESEQSVHIEADFRIAQPYSVKLLGGLKARDDLPMNTSFIGNVSFQLIQPAVALPAFSVNQLSHGRRAFDIEAVNMAELTIQVKAADRESLIYALRAYQRYTGASGEEEEPTPADQDAGMKRLDFRTMPGRAIFEKKYLSNAKLDSLDELFIDWDDVLKGRKSGALFISIEGRARPEWSGRKTRFGAQAFVQLTDIGLAWKVTADEAFVHAFSEATGRPLGGVTLTALDAENRPLATATSAADGSARLARGEAAWLIAENGDDVHAVSLGDDIQVLGMWRMGVPYDWEPAEASTRHSVIFTDRPVYLPGDTVFYKAISRMIASTGPATIPAGQKATLEACDSRGKVFNQRDVILSATGAIDGAIELPHGSLGQYRLTLTFPKPEPKPDADAEEPETEHAADSTSHYFLVEEYKPNTFAVAFDDAAFKLEGEKATIPLRARYLLGKSLSKAHLAWTAEVGHASFNAELFPDFRFLDSRETYYWDEDGYHDVPDDEEDDGFVTAQSKSELSEKGEATLEFTVPSARSATLPRRISVSAEVTDVNQQTITERWQRTLHPSEFYLGIRDLDFVTAAGEPLTIDVAAAKTDGSPWPEAIDARITIEKISFDSVRVQTAGGGSNIRTDARKEVVAEGGLRVVPRGQDGGSFAWKPADPGFYYITARANDRAGHAVESITSVQIFGDGWATWDVEEGVRIALAPDKPEYRPGETAKVLVKSPIAGHALVTVERRSVMKSFVTEIKSNAQAVEVPIDDSMAPNAFISVFITRGAEASPREHKSPDYKIGVCQIKVIEVRSRLAVAVAAAQPEYRPGDQGTATARVTDGQGRPIAGAEVTFWAADEGILSLVGFEVPDPWSEFHQPQALAVQTGTSLQALLPENPNELEFTNKGYVIGGGGIEAMAERLRKNFRPVAFWHGALPTDADGRVTATFTVPDNLTEFRLFAVASHEAERFGSGEGRFRINKPLMLDPALPRFANVGDQVTAKGIVLNNTDRAFEAEVTLALDSTATCAQELKKKIALAAHETKAVGFPLSFVEPGLARWKWTVRALAAEPLADAVESTLDVGFAQPWLREVKFLPVSAETANQNLLARVNPELLEGRGEITVTLSNSTLAEASEAIVHLLHYPYGCVEQTTSSTLPWVTLHEVGDALPGVQKDPAQVQKAIQHGVQRLLSMQTADGGLGYWPGARHAELWASVYGGMGLALCQKSGAVVPATRLNELAAYLSTQLRNTASLRETTEFLDRAFACYTLALLGKPEPAYPDLLEGKVSRLAHPARALLALAILESGGDRDHAISVLDAPLDRDLEQWAANIFESRLTALNLLVWARLDAKSPVTVSLTERLLRERTPRGDWGSTYENAWALRALTAESLANMQSLGKTTATLTFAGKSEKVEFPARPASRTMTFAFSGKPDERNLRIESPAFLRAAIEVKARPRVAPVEPRSNGMSIARRYEKLTPDGRLGPADALEIGDLVAVTLDLDVPSRARYLAVDDALPSIFEAVNPKFKSQASTGAATPATSPDKAQPWWSSFEELRKDRALFFADEIWTPGKFQIRYLARVAAEGNAIAPPAKIEMMYDPERYGLSGSQMISARRGDEKVAGK